MLKKLSVAALVAGMSVAAAPVTISIAHAQANEPPSAPNPSDSGAAGSSPDKGDMAPAKPMKKMSKHHTMMKKKHHM